MPKSPTTSKTSFSAADIEKIANLAQLELTEAEKATFARQFAEILAYFRKIEEVDTSAVAAAANPPSPFAERGSGGEVTPPPAPPVFREDKAERSGISPDSFSPYLEDGHYKVPKVID